MTTQASKNLVFGWGVGPVGRAEGGPGGLPCRKKIFFFIKNFFAPKHSPRGPGWVGTPKIPKFRFFDPKRAHFDPKCPQNGSNPAKKNSIASRFFCPKPLPKPKGSRMGPPPKKTETPRFGPPNGPNLAQNVPKETRFSQGIRWAGGCG